MSFGSDNISMSLRGVLSRSNLLSDLIPYSRCFIGHHESLFGPEITAYARNMFKCYSNTFQLTYCCFCNMCRKRIATAATPLWLLQLLAISHFLLKLPVILKTHESNSQRYRFLNLQLLKDFFPSKFDKLPEL
jgi:hypothetical protein